MFTYTLIDLGGLVAGGTCYPSAVQVVSGDVRATGSADTSGAALDPFLYRNGAMTDLGVNIGGSGMGMAINHQSDVAGALSPSPTASLLTPFVKKASGASTFPTLPDKFGMYPLSINDGADVAGRYLALFSEPEFGGWYCLDGGQPVDLTVTVNSDIRRASQINNARKIVGDTNSGSFFAYDATAQTLQTLPLTSAFLSEDRDIFINNAGQIAANATTGPVFLQNGSPIPMSPPPSPASIMLRGLNDLGQVIFTPIDAFDDQGLVFVSDPLSPTGTTAPAIYNVNDYLVAPGWKVTQLTGIASDGSLVGFAKSLGGDARGVLLVPLRPGRASIPWTAAFVRILFGIIQDGGGFEIPGGPVPPWDPLAAFAASLNPGQKDVLVGFAVHALAARIVDPVARHEIQLRATTLIQQAAPRMNAPATLELPGGESAGRIGERARQRDPERFKRLLQAHPKKT